MERTVTFGEKEDLMKFLKAMDQGEIEVGCPGCCQCNGPDLVSSKFKDLGGEYLMYPTDTSHGASVKNTINCRCESVLTLIRG